VPQLAEQIRPGCPGRYTVLGTDGFRPFSDTREKLRHFFEVDRRWIVLAALSALADEGTVPKATVAEAMQALRPRSRQAKSGEGLSHVTAHRSQGSRHRRLQGRSGDRGAGQGRRHGQGRGLTGHPRIRQGDHGRTVAGLAEGSLVAVVDSGAAAQAPAAAPAPAPAAAAPAPAPAPAAAAAATVEVRVPDIGDFKDVPIIEVLVKVGDTVKAEDPLMTLESDKATMDIPSPASGVIAELKVGVGDKVAEGTLLALLKVSAGTQSAGAGATAAAAAPAPAAASRPAPAPAAVAAAPAPAPAGGGASVDFRPGDAELITQPPRVAMPTPADRLVGKAAHASPSVRRFARDLGVDVSKVPGTGPKGRILQGDVQAWVKGVLSAPPPAPAAASGGNLGGMELLPWPKIDFSKFGPIEVQPLSRIKKISGANLARNWVMIPAVTYHEDADITDLEPSASRSTRKTRSPAPS
jgi:pyruvate dehydrogenase E2 component (dihydrolipoamide acetyltransferase)